MTYNFITKQFYLNKLLNNNKPNDKITSFFQHWNRGNHSNGNSTHVFSARTFFDFSWQFPGYVFSIFSFFSIGDRIHSKEAKGYYYKLEIKYLYLLLNTFKQ
jgi:hypothetical protein